MPEKIFACILPICENSLYFRYVMAISLKSRCPMLRIDSSYMEISLPRSDLGYHKFFKPSKNSALLELICIFDRVLLLKISNLERLYFSDSIYFFPDGW
jgi:hypothetical protein